MVGEDGSFERFGCPMFAWLGRVVEGMFGPRRSGVSVLRALGCLQTRHLCGRFSFLIQ